MRTIYLGAIWALGACATSGVETWGGNTGRTQVAGHRFRVHYTTEHAQAYRTNATMRPRAQQIFPAAINAIEKLSGCKVIRHSITGDVAMIKADLRC